MSDTATTARKPTVMHPVIAKTFGGLSLQYYFRQFMFGLAVPVFIIYTTSHPISIGMIVWLVLNTLLYPYSRFVYEGVMGFLVGQNVFLVNAFFMFFVKFITMMICWGFALFIAPVGLAYLYYHHSKGDNQV